MEYELAAALAAFGIVTHSSDAKVQADRVLLVQLSRGNAYLNLLSIGGPAKEVPPLPGKIDGPVAGGLATHGRFEGSTSPPSTVE